jgi:ribosomal protein L7/L12
LTGTGEIPISIAYEHSDKNEVIAERMRVFLNMSSKTLIVDSIKASIANGKDIDAIRLLREKSGISLNEAKAIVTKIKESGETDRPLDVNKIE